MVSLGRRALLALGACFLAMRVHGARAAEPVAGDEGLVILHGWVLKKSDLKQLAP